MIISKLKMDRMELFKDLGEKPKFKFRLDIKIDEIRKRVEEDRVGM